MFSWICLPSSWRTWSEVHDWAHSGRSLYSCTWGALILSKSMWRRWSCRILFDNLTSWKVDLFSSKKCTLVFVIFCTWITWWMFVWMNTWCFLVIYFIIIVLLSFCTFTFRIEIASVIKVLFLLIVNIMAIRITVWIVFFLLRNVVLTIGHLIVILFLFIDFLLVMVVLKFIVPSVYWILLFINIIYDITVFVIFVSTAIVWDK